VVLCLGLVLFINLVTALTKSHQLLNISFLGFLLVTIGGGFGAYWIAGLALRPVKNISKAASLIDVDTLSTRLEVASAQDEIRNLADTFNAMLDRLEQAFELQSRFVADAAHELRTPLASLRTNLEVARRNPHITLNDYQKLFSTVERAVARLESLVTALLVLATEKQALIQQEVAVLPLIEEVFSSLQPVCEKHEVTLSLQAQTHASLYGDEHLLALVFRNLIENAIRYNHPGGTVILCIDETPLDVVICIADTGVGIAPEEQVHIFERFYRVDHSRSRHKGGAGLGLSIVHHILDLHNGTITLEKSSATGSTFRMTLPTCAKSQVVMEAAVRA
jgi:signal transduction histidine kinase